MTWHENQAKIRNAMKHFKSYTTIELAKATKLTRTTVYGHLNVMLTTGTVTRNGNRFRLINPVEQMNDSISTALLRIPNPRRLELLMIDDDPDHTITVTQDMASGRKVLEHYAGYATVDIPENSSEPSSKKSVFFED
jgi:hypothetical protein